MNSHIAQLNLVLAWLWIVVGFGIGFVFGMHFHKERWLGGYASFQRRLYRLAHRLGRERRSGPRCSTTLTAGG